MKPSRCGNAMLDVDQSREGSVGLPTRRPAPFHASGHARLAPAQDQHVADPARRGRAVSLARFSGAGSAPTDACRRPWIGRLRAVFTQ